jgi:hypothetical protein
MSPPSSGSTNKPSKKPAEAGSNQSFYDRGDMFLRKFPSLFNGLHGVISQKTELFITTGVRTSSPTN